MTFPSLPGLEPLSNTLARLHTIPVILNYTEAICFGYLKASVTNIKGTISYIIQNGFLPLLTLTTSDYDSGKWGLIPYTFPMASLFKFFPFPWVVSKAQPVLSLDCTLGKLPTPRSTPKAPGLISLGEGLDIRMLKSSLGDSNMNSRLRTMAVDSDTSRRLGRKAGAVSHWLWGGNLGWLLLILPDAAGLYWYEGSVQLYCFFRRGADGGLA